MQSGLDRELGFKEEMKKYPGIKVAATLNGGGRRDSALKADVAQQPRDLGAKTIEAISKHFAGGPVEKSISVPVKIVDANSPK